MTVRAAVTSLVSPQTTTLSDGSVIHSSALGSVIKCSWSGLTNGDSGAPVDLTQFSDRSIQVEGALGAGGTVIIEGSNDGSNYHTLTDALGNALSLTALTLKVITETTGWIRPRVSAGDGTTTLIVTMSACRAS